MARKIGDVQRHVLRSLVDHKDWHENSGWLWDTTGNTTRIMESLLKRGLVTKTMDGPLTWRREPLPVYRINAAGRKALTDGQ